MIKKNILNYFNKSPRHGQRLPPHRLWGFPIGPTRRERTNFRHPFEETHENITSRRRSANDVSYAKSHLRIVVVNSTAAVESTGAACGLQNRKSSRKKTKRRRHTRIEKPTNESKRRTTARSKTYGRNARNDGIESRWRDVDLLRVVFVNLSDMTRGVGPISSAPLSPSLKSSRE